MRRMWQIWPGQRFPFTFSQERIFLGELEALAVKPTRADRDDVTVLLSLLRNGCSLEAARQFAPGLRPAPLLAAYRRLDRALVASLRAWDAIVADPTPKVWEINRVAAAKLFPAAIERLGMAADRSDRFAQAIAQVSRRMDAVKLTAEGVEQQCLLETPTSSRLRELSSALFCPTAACVYGDPLYRPDRLASLSPNRVGDLLVAGKS